MALHLSTQTVLFYLGSLNCFPMKSSHKVDEGFDHGILPIFDHQGRKIYNRLQKSGTTGSGRLHRYGSGRLRKRTRQIQKAYPMFVLLKFESKIRSVNRMIRS